MTESRCHGRLRARPEDFRVEEVLGFEPGQGGEHLWVELEKTGWNTADVALQLARAASLPVRAVGFSGLKDRHAVTRQWFSLHLPGRADPELSALPSGIRVLNRVRHGRKLNRGTHRGNRFSITVRELQGEAGLIRQALEQIRRDGVPNYFGEQRFGRDDNNVRRALEWLRAGGAAPRKPALRSLWLSALRSRLFNEVLAERERRGVWNRVLPGDLLQPDGSRGLFRADDDPAAEHRVASGDVHPTAPLPGRGGLQPEGEAAALEAQVLAPWQDVVAALAAEGVEAARRSTRLPVQDLHWQQQDQTLTMHFLLPAGAFATSVLATFMDWNDHVVDRE